MEAILDWGYLSLIRQEAEMTSTPGTRITRLPMEALRALTPKKATPEVHRLLRCSPYKRKMGVKVIVNGPLAKVFSLGVIEN
jgi:hypothetical protein